MTSATLPSGARAGHTLDTLMTLSMLPIQIGIGFVESGTLLMMNILAAARPALSNPEESSAAGERHDETLSAPEERTVEDGLTEPSAPA